MVFTRSEPNSVSSSLLDWAYQWQKTGSSGRVRCQVQVSRQVTEYIVAWSESEFQLHLEVVSSDHATNDRRNIASSPDNMLGDTFQMLRRPANFGHDQWSLFSKDRTGSCSTLLGFLFCDSDYPITSIRYSQQYGTVLCAENFEKEI